MLGRMTRSRSLRILGIVVIAMFVAWVSAVAHAQTPGDREGVTLRIRGDITIGEGEIEGVVVVIDGNATVDGTVTEALIVIKGNATVRGRVDGRIVVIDGTLRL